MEAIRPRWEWRAFGTAFASAEQSLAGVPTTDVVESDEVYLVAPGDGDVAKIRGGLMDVKHLREVDDHGLELWMPVMKAEFPLPAEVVRAVASALGVDAADTEVATPDELVAALGRGVRAVEVHKHRQRYVVSGCMVELTDVVADGTPTRTVAVEAEDPAAVVATVAELGLDVRTNHNYRRGLSALLGLGADRYAVIDVGTNSVKFHVAERATDGAWRTVVDRAEVTRLGEGLTGGGELGSAPMARTADAIVAMAEEARRLGVVEIAAVGTAGMRMATNSAVLVDAVRDRCGVGIEVISGEEESRIAYLAATSGLGATGSLVVFDTGGGSSQLTFSHDGEVDERFSVDVGAVRFTEAFALAGPVDDLGPALAAIAADLSRLDGRPTPALLVGLGGVNTNLAAVRHGLAAYDADVVHGTLLDRAEVDRQVELYRTRTADERREIPGLQPARAEVILAGACIVRTVLEKLGVDSYRVSDRGLRHGVLVERFG